MTTLIASDAVLQMLQQAKDPVEIRDGNGRTVGYYAPVSLDQAAVVARSLARIDWAEMDRRSRSTDPGVSTCEVFRYLQSLTPDEETRTYLQRKIDGLADGPQLP
jgi:hypothetical protein